MSQRQQIIPLRGGLDLVSPAMMKDPGAAIAALNYEPEARGYRRMAGYERFDGRPAPSDATYSVIRWELASLSPLPLASAFVGETLAGTTGTATVLQFVNEQPDEFQNPFGYLVVYNPSADFTVNVGQVLVVAGVWSQGATALTTAETILVADEATHDQLITTITALRRAAITAPPGTGPIRGITTFRGEVLCWRTHTSGTYTALWKATASGWVELATAGCVILPFKDGTAQIFEGDSISLATGSAIAHRVVLQGGAWSASGKAYGYIVCTSVSYISGSTSLSGAIQVSGATKALSDVQSSVQRPATGNVRAIQANFYARTEDQRLYFTVSGGRAWEWDGTNLAQIRINGLSTAQDKPQHLAEHKGHLFLSFKGGSVLFSATGEPLNYQVLGGAGEFGFQQDVTGLKPNTKDSLVITGRNKIGYLVGSSSSEFELKTLSEDSGAIANTLEVVGGPIFMDDQGLRELQAVQSYGDWSMGTLTTQVEPLLEAKKRRGIEPIGCLRVRARNQYRLFFSDGTGITVYLGRKAPEILPFSLPFVPSCFHSGEDAKGNEVLLVGAPDGMVYRIDAGTSQDGANIEAFVRLAFTNQGMPNRNKRYHRGRFEGQAGVRNTQLSLAADFSYGDDMQPPALETDFMMRGSGGFWDESTWETFNWSAPVEGQSWADLQGIGENVSAVFMSDSATEEPHTLSTLTITYSVRGQLR